MVNAVVTISRSQQRFAQCAELQSRLAGLMRTRLSKSFFKAFCTGVMSPIPSYRFAKIRPWERVACASLMRSTRRNRSCLLTGALRLPSTGKFTTAARSPQHPGRDQPKSGFRSVEFEDLTPRPIRSRPARTACHGAKASFCLGSALVVNARGRNAATPWQGKG